MQYAKRVVGRKVYGGQSSPLKINTSGVIPPIFASSIIILPATMTGSSTSSGSRTSRRSCPRVVALYDALRGPDHLLLCFFYTAVVFNPIDVAENMKKHGGHVPGIRPGKRTSDYIYYVLTRITLRGDLSLRSCA